MYLLDTNVISELRKAASGRANPHVRAWAAGADAATLFLSAITLLELELGTLRMERRDPQQGAALRSWLENHILPSFANRILAVDIPVARKGAFLQVPNPRPYRDSLIAATALIHGMTVVTRSTSDFKGTGVVVLNPWQG